MFVTRFYDQPVYYFVYYIVTHDDRVTVHENRTLKGLERVNRVHNIMTTRLREGKQMGEFTHCIILYIIIL